MSRGKKSGSVEDIINGYQKFHHKGGKGFKDRIKKIEEFHDPENIHAQQFSHHAHYTIFGRPGSEKEYPGAYNEAYKKLDKHLGDDAAKLEDEDKLTEILETYVDTFLQTAMGDNYKKTMEHAQKEAKLNKKDLRELKGALMSRYHTNDEGRPINILDEMFIKKLKGKKKIELIDELRGLSENVRDSYARHLVGTALEGLVSEDDRVELAKYITPAFEERGWKSKKPHIMRSVHEQVGHYGALLAGAGDQLRKLGYKPLKYEKKEKPGKK